MLTLSQIAALPDHVLAYIGPGAGLGALIVTIALLLGAVLLLAGLVWYPLKRLRKGRAANAASGGRADDLE
jgi:hypothetical protein